MPPRKWEKEYPEHIGKVDAKIKADTISHHTTDLRWYHKRLVAWSSAPAKALKEPEVLHGIAYAFYPYPEGAHKKNPRSYYKRKGVNGWNWPQALVDCKLITKLRYEFSLRDSGLVYVSARADIDKRKAEVEWDWYSFPYMHVGSLDLKKYSVEDIEDAWRVHGLMTKQAPEVKRNPRIYAVFRAMKAASND